MNNPVKEMMNSVNGLKQSLDGVKQSVNGMKETIDSARQHIQDTVEMAKDKTAGIKTGVSRMKESVQETKDVVLEATHAVMDSNARAVPLPEEGFSSRPDDPGAPEAPSGLPAPVHEGSGFFLRDNGTMIGELTYLPLDGVNTWVIDYAYVAPAYRGRGVGKLLVDEAVSRARVLGRQIVPACSYVRAQFMNRADYEDVWRR